MPTPHEAYVIESEYDHSHTRTAVGLGEAALPEANFMLQLVERWGMVAATPAGEDSSGRQKLRLSTPEELVARATEMTALVFHACRDAGWIVPIPMPQLTERARAKLAEASASPES